MAEIVLTAEQLATQLIGEIGNPFRVRITGFPACGKSTISGLGSYVSEFRKLEERRLHTRSEVVTLLRQELEKD